MPVALNHSDEGSSLLVGGDARRFGKTQGTANSQYFARSCPDNFGEARSRHELPITPNKRMQTARKMGKLNGGRSSSFWQVRNLHRRISHAPFCCRASSTHFLAKSNCSGHGSGDLTKLSAPQPWIHACLSSKM